MSLCPISSTAGGGGSDVGALPTTWPRWCPRPRRPEHRGFSVFHPHVSAVTLSKRFYARPLPTRPLVMVKQHSQRAWGNGEVNWGLMGASLVDLMESLRFGNTICTWKEQGKLWAGLQRGAWWALGPHRCCCSHHACVSPGVPAGHSTTVGGAAGPLTRPQALVKVPPSG